jgi:hypothetical protein
MKVVDWEWYERARELFARYQNCSRVHDVLREEGCKKTYATVTRWYRENREEWQQIAEGYNNNSKENATVNFQNKRLQELIDLKEKLSKRVEYSLDNDDKKIDSQSVFALKSLITEINYLFKSLQPKESDSSIIVNIVMDVFLGHPVIGPQVVEFKKEILKEIDKRLKKK